MGERYSLRGKRVWVAGHGGMVGAAMVRRLAGENCEVLTVSRQDLDLRDQAKVRAWIGEFRPDAIVLAAATVGGILANESYPADFLFDNLVIETNVIQGAFTHGVEKLLFLGSSCIYPKFAPQPMVEEALLTGPLEPTNEWYAIAKIAGLKLANAYRRQHGCDFISAMPTNLYGPGDNFNLTTSHVLPALVRKAHEAKMARADAIVVWGSGDPRREFLHVDDCADALLHLLCEYSEDSHINIGYGRDIGIGELARLVSDVVGFDGEIVFDTTKPDGPPRKLLSSERIFATGWRPQIDLADGIRATYAWYLDHIPTSEGDR